MEKLNRFGLALLTLTALSATGPQDDAPELLRRHLQKTGPIAIRGERICAVQALSQFYGPRYHHPAWTMPTARELVSVLQRVELDGLDPADYHLATISEMLRQGTPHSPADLAGLDLLLSDAFFLAAHHLVSGRVDPETFIPTWCLEPRRLDLPAVLEAALRHDQVGTSLERVRPTGRGYEQLRAALSVYQEITATGGWPEVTSGPSLRAGDSGARVRELRERLAGDAESALALQSSRDSFDAPLQEAVKAFQRRHGLDPDGVVGGATLRALNVPTEDRVEQIRVNLERFRWLPQDLGHIHLLVNLAAFSLAVIEDRRPMLQMPVIVGKAAQETPVFSAAIDEVVLNPYWNVPRSIAEKEILPAARKDRSYLKRNHIEVLPTGEMRQQPGPWNALGRIKFSMPNRHSVYLHDTPERELFQQSRRAFSHGCIRIEKPLDLAEFLLRDQGWTGEKILAEIRLVKEKRIGVTGPVPVHILYWTAWVDNNGAVNFRPDLYQRDPRVAAALRTHPHPL